MITYTMTQGCNYGTRREVRVTLARMPETEEERIAIRKQAWEAGRAFQLPGQFFCFMVSERFEGPAA